jgi:hypothetical protein
MCASRLALGAPQIEHALFTTARGRAAPLAAGEAFSVFDTSAGRAESDRFTTDMSPLELRC